MEKFRSVFTGDLNCKSLRGNSELYYYLERGTNYSLTGLKFASDPARHRFTIDHCVISLF